MKNVIFILIIFFGSITTLKADVKKWNLEQVGFLNIDRNEKDYGGFSGLIVKENGSDILAITDKSFFFEMNLERDEEGILTGYSLLQKGQLLSSKGQKLSGRNIDSESIALDHENKYYISFESNHRVTMHENIYSKGLILPKHKDFKNMSINKGIEALAVDKENRILAIPEEPPLGMSHIPIFRLQDNTWIIIKTIEMNDEFLVTDAEILPQGLLLILERKFSWIQGFRTRFRLLSLDKSDNQEPITVFTSTANQFDNLEGMSLWKDKKNRLRILTISDDNFHPFQQSEIREFLLKYE